MAISFLNFPIFLIVANHYYPIEYNSVLLNDGFLLLRYRMVNLNFKVIYEVFAITSIVLLVKLMLQSVAQVLVKGHLNQHAKIIIETFE